MKNYLKLTIYKCLMGENFKKIHNFAIRKKKARITAPGGLGPPGPLCGGPGGHLGCPTVDLPDTLNYPPAVC